MPAEEALELDKILLAERFGWTFEYIESLDVNEFRELLVRCEALDAARKSKRGD